MKKYLRLLLVLFTFLLIEKSDAQTLERRSSTAVLKFEPMPQHGGPIISVRLEHDVTARFLIDTGANATGLTPDLLQKLKLIAGPQFRKGKMVVDLSHLEIGPWDIPGGEFVILDGPSLPALKQLKIDGVLGTNFLGTCAVFLNWEKQECSLFYPGKLPKDQVEALGFKEQEAVAIPLPLDRTNGHYGIETQIAGKTETLFIDTGRQRTILPKSYPIEVLGKPIWERDALTVKGVKKEAVYLVSEVLVGGARGGKQAVFVSKDNHGTLTHMLGMDFLAQLRTCYELVA